MSLAAIMANPADIREKAWPGRAAPFRAAPRFLAACLLLLGLHYSSLRAEAQVSKEYQLKSVFLFRLAQFVEWPTNRFSAPEDPIIIGVLGRNPFGEALPLAIRGESAHNRSFKIEELQPSDDIRRCHIVFICRSEAPRIKAITSSLAGQSVLTVSDMDDFVTTHGGMVQFLTDKNKVNLRIHLDAARAAGLELNSRLLRMAEVIKSE